MVEFLLDFWNSKWSAILIGILIGCVFVYLTKESNMGETVTIGELKIFDVFHFRGVSDRPCVYLDVRQYMEVGGKQSIHEFNNPYNTSKEVILLGRMEFIKLNKVERDLIDGLQNVIDFLKSRP